MKESIMEIKEIERDFFSMQKRFFVGQLRDTSSLRNRINQFLEMRGENEGEKMVNLCRDIPFCCCGNVPI